MKNRVLINVWDAAGVLSSLWNKYSATLPSSATIWPLVLFSAIKIVLWQVATWSLWLSIFVILLFVLRHKFKYYKVYVVVNFAVCLVFNVCSIWFYDGNFVQVLQLSSIAWNQMELKGGFMTISGEHLEKTDN